MNVNDLFDTYKASVLTVIENHTQLELGDETDVLRKEFSEDLNCDEIDISEMMMTLEEEHNVEFTDDEVDSVESVLDAILLLLRKNSAVSGDDFQTILDKYCRDTPETPAPETVRRSLSQPRGPSKTDWNKVDAKTDADIARDVASDPDAAPLLQEGEDLGKIIHPKKMSQETMDQVIDEATHAALNVLRSSGVRINSMQTDALNDSITLIVQRDNRSRSA